MILKIKDKNYSAISYNEKIRITGVLLCKKDPDPVFSQIRIRNTARRILIRIRTTIRDPKPCSEHCFYVQDISGTVPIL